MPYITRAAYNRLIRDRARSERDRQRANVDAVAARAEVRALHQFLDYDLPAEVARPAQRIRELEAKNRALAADRAAWRSRAQVAEQALRNQRAIPLMRPVSPDGEDTLTMPRPAPPLPPQALVQRASSAWATQRDIATLQHALGGAA
jgi:hypothetical protein